MRERTELEQSILVLWQEGSGDYEKRAENIANRFDEQTTKKLYGVKVTPEYVLKVYDERFDTKPPRKRSYKRDSFRLTELILRHYLLYGLNMKQIRAHLAYVLVEGKKRVDYKIIREVIDAYHEVSEE